MLSTHWNLLSLHQLQNLMTYRIRGPTRHKSYRGCYASLWFREVNTLITDLAGAALQSNSQVVYRMVDPLLPAGHGSKTRAMHWVLTLIMAL